MSNSKVVYEGWMVRYGRRKIGRSFIHMRYFVLESRLLAYYKKKPQDNVVHTQMSSVEMGTVNAVQMQKEVPIKTLLIDGNCRVEDRGLKTHHGHIDVDIGSSTVANGVLGLVIGVITTLVVEMAFLVQATATEELPERLIGAVQISHIELSSAVVPVMETDSSS
ncbi:UNVERIFIED_CONTAM: protein ENHANCED DISEASE RESISTANCE 2-like [Sesamum radiatum]|uniref:Protein ENHANCED DISEASE RESISTANCE 2-like n=1 Tax=Sesamum radiatum TaxID=300843 RepID=A0AAW2TTZ1_SESRA